MSIANESGPFLVDNDNEPAEVEEMVPVGVEEVEPVGVEEVRPSVEEVPENEVESLNAQLCERRKFWIAGSKKGPAWAFFCVSGDSADLSEGEIITAQTLELACALCARGRIRWKKENGSSSLRAHVKQKHDAELSGFLTYLKDATGSTSKRKKSQISNDGKRFKLRTITEALRMGQKTYHVNNVENKRFEDDVVLYICKSLSPLSTVQCPWFARLILGRDAKLQIPSRSRLCRTLLPKAVEFTRKTYVTATLDRAPIIALTFDLWMSCGNMDIFSVLAHTLDETFERKVLHLALLKTDNTSAEKLSSSLQTILDENNCADKVVASVFDGGLNLKKAHETLVQLTLCDFVGKAIPYAGRCITVRLFSI